jgi:hypothetical protein
MNLHTRTAGLVLSAVLTAATSAQCGSGGTHQSRACDAEIVRPSVRVVQYHSGKNAMQAEAVSSCDPQPVSYHLHLTLDFYDTSQGAAGEWVVQGTQTCSELPPKPPESITCTVALFNICKPGRWRARVLVTGHTNEDFANELPEKPVTLITDCSITSR